MVARPGRVGRAEAALIGAVVALAFLLRVWRIQDVALQHYDEGMFALGGLWSVVFGQAPDWLAHYAPPLFPALLGVLFRVAGPSDTAVLLLNVGLSTLTVLVIWHAGRQWFGPAAGVAAAILLALNESHIILARSGLTDTLFALLFLTALVRIHIALRTQRLLDAVVAGALVGLAWNTKYHGWFALVVALGALAAGALRPGDRTRPGRLDRGAVRAWVVMASVATLCFVPWALTLGGSSGGLAGVVAHYRGFLSLTPLSYALRDATNEMFLEGWLTRASVPAALFGALLLAPTARPLTVRFALWTLSVGVLAVAMGGAGAMLVLSIVAAPQLARPKPLSEREVAPAGMLVLVWLALWIVAAPFYYPYARLLLPFTLATALASAVLLAQLAGSDGSPEVPSHARRPGRRVVAASVAVVAALVARLPPDASDPWRPIPEMREIAADLDAALPADSRLVVIGEPALQFYLYLLGRPSAAGEAPSSGADRGLVIAGLYAEHVPEADGLLPPPEARSRPLMTFPLVPSDIRLLDDYESAGATRYREEPDARYDLRLWSMDR